MKKIILTLSVLCLTSLVHARIGRTAWELADDKGKAEIIKIYQTWFSEVSKVEAVADWEEKKTTYFKLFSEAWAAEGMDCIYAGWPSKRIGSCSSPTRSNPDYQQGSCSSNEMQCQPLLFGGGLCVSVASREARNSAFSNCNNKFQQAGRNAAFVVSEVKANNQEELLLSLLDFADQICESGVQANTGMCNRLKAQVAEVRSELESATEAAVAIVNNLTSELAQVSRQPLECGRGPALTLLTEEPLIVDTRLDLSDLQVAPPILIVDDETEDEEDSKPIQEDKSVDKVVEVVEATDVEAESDSDEEIPSDVVADQVSTMAPFLRDRPRGRLGLDLCGGKRSPQMPDGLNAGFSYMTTLPCSGGSSVQAGISVEGANYHLVNFESVDGSKAGTFLSLEEPVLSSDSHNVKSMVFLLPRRGIPSAEVVGNEIHVTLPTGEIVVYDRATRAIKSGALREGPADQNTDRFTRRPPNVHYNGSGISIRVDHRYEYPTSASGDPTAEVKQNGRTCSVPRARLWNADGEILLVDDDQLVRQLNQICPARAGERPFEI